MKKAMILFMLAGLLQGCFNMPTPTAQITGSYSSGVQYKGYTCGELANEIESISRRENQLIVAQEARIKTSKLQAFFNGYGAGDGIEASELANVRGKKEAMRTALEAKDC